MKSSSNPDSTDHTLTQPDIETGQMNKTMPTAIDAAVEVQSEQPSPVIDVERDDLTVFFAVGIVINIVMITAYFVWAYKQWGKAGARDE